MQEFVLLSWPSVTLWSNLEKQSTAAGAISFICKSASIIKLQYGVEK